MTQNLAEIKEALKRNDNTCLKVFFKEHANYCTGYLVKNTNCTKDDADDLFVDAILNIREKILNGKIEHLTNTRAYLYSTCYNMWLAKYNKAKSQEAKTKDIQNFYEEPVVSSTEKEELFALANKALSTLGAKCQRIIQLFYLYSFSMSDIAEEMGFASAGVAKSTKSRCYKQLILAAKDLQNENHVF